MSHTLRFARFDPTPCNFPAPKVPLLARQGAWGEGGPDSVFLDGRSAFYSRGRYALKAALQALGYGPGDVVLVPSYHCRTMLDPALELGGQVELFSLTPFLTPRLDLLENRVLRASRPVKALLLPHYFGFPQQLAPVLALCQRHGIALIEDCSHAFFGQTELGPVGSVGDYAIASPYKFFPSADGGLVRANAAQPLPSGPGRRAWKQEAAAALALARLRLGGVGEAPLPPLADAPAAQPLPPPALEPETETPALSCHYQPEQADLAGLAASRWVMMHADRAHLAERRRAHYRDWLARVAPLPRCRPLFTGLPEGVVPYMFPLLLEDCETDFYRLKQQGMPLWRWDEQALSNCEVASTYRKHLVHLPCHQGLSPAQMDWMGQLLARVLGA